MKMENGDDRDLVWQDDEEHSEREAFQECASDVAADDGELLRPFGHAREHRVEFLIEGRAQTRLLDLLGDSGLSGVKLSRAGELKIHQPRTLRSFFWISARTSDQGLDSTSPSRSSFSR